MELAQTLFDEVTNSLGQTNSSSINEAKIRSSISRAYYSAFCLVRNYLRDIEGYSNLKTDKIGIHEYVIKELESSKNADRRYLGQCLSRLRGLRNEVDYEDYIASNLLIPKAKQTLKDANKVIELLNKLTSSQKP
ncbi:HEPN domain-containing protein [Nostoc mirabile]|uniref:HEPN domain-containing protein n=1 Tax=Nostoc mirabile TaxID=2907820 RepID=UPI001E35E28A|nr:HEPN domain-containing protein [Nostoc mirabile]